MKKKHFLLILTLVFINFVDAQDSNRNKEIVLSLGPAINRIVNVNVDNDEYKKVDNQTGINVNFSYCKYFTNSLGLRVGVEFSSYKQTVYQNGLFEKTNQIDRDDNVYDLWMNSKVTYVTNLKYLNIPIMLHAVSGKSKLFYWFMDVGIVNGVLLGGKYTQNGSIESMGRYTTDNQYFNIVSQENSYYDYKKVNYEKETTDEYKTYNLLARISLGIVANISNNTSLRVSVEYSKGITDISGKNNMGIEYSNVFGAKQSYQKTKTNSLGLNIGAVFNL